MEGQIPTDLLEKVQKAYFEGDFSPIHYIYADLEALQDFRLGALLCLITTEPEYDYIQHRLPEYNGRFDDCTMKYFPIITDITDKDIDAHIANPDNHLVLARVSPMTIAYDLLPELIVQMHMNNSRCGDSKRIELTIGTNSVRYGNQEKQNLANALTANDGFLDVTILNRPLTEIEHEVMMQFNVHLWYDVAKYLRDQVIGHEFGEESSFFEKRIFALPLLETIPKEGETAEQLLANTKAVLDVCCSFAYVERGLQEILQ